ncbi:TPA: MucBP domain-containing protein, partial [Streptococcus suis]
NGKATGIDSVTGDVVAGETKEITYVYQLVTGSVVARYVIEGTEDEIADDKSVKPKDTPVDEVYGDTPPTTITKDGKKYILVRTREKEGDAPKDGKVIEGEQTITYEYKEVKETPEVKSGNVNVNYVDTEGNVIKDKVADVVNEPAGTDYDTVVDNKPTTITKDGKTYKLVPSGSYKVGVVGSNNNLIEVGNGKAKGTDPVTGDVVADETKEITYVYQLVTGSVVARYVIEGTEDEIADDKSVKPKETPVDEVYGDTPPTTITKDGKKYILVRTRENEGDAPKDGKVIEGEQTITYEYKEVKETPEVKSGNVVITYVDTEGNPLKSEVKDTTDGEVGSEYNTKENGDEYPETIVKDGVTYKRVKAGNHTVGETTEDGHLVSSDKPAGTVEEGTKTVTYVYEKVTGSVVARYVIEGTEDEIADDKSVKPKETPVDEVYGDTPPLIIEKNGKKYILVRTRTNEGDAPKDGKVIEGEQVITYEYKELEENPTPVPPTPRPNPGRPGTPVTPTPGRPGTPVTPTPGKPGTPATPTPGKPGTPVTPTPGKPGTPATPAPGKPGTPATPAKPATPAAGQAQLPNTGEASSSATVLGAAMLVAALALVGKRRRNSED